MTKFATVTLTRVSDIMASPVVTISASETLAAAEAILLQHHISGAPVVGSGGRVTGVISTTDLAGIPTREKSLLGVIERATRVLYGVRADDPAMLAVRLMVEERIHRVLVVGYDGALVGIVTPMDVMRALSSRRLTTDGAHEGLSFFTFAPHV